MKVGLYIDWPGLLDDEDLMAVIKDSPVTKLWVYMDKTDGTQLLSADECHNMWEQDIVEGPEVGFVAWPQDGGWDAFSIERYGRVFPRWNLEANEKQADPVEAAYMRQLGEDVTTHQGHAEGLRGRSQVFRYLGGEIQAYSTNSAVRKYGSSFLPGKCQENAVHRGLACCGMVPEVALALYSQTGMKGYKDPQEAMATAVKTCKSLSVPAINYWSAKWLRKEEGNQYARDFLTKTLPGLL